MCHRYAIASAFASAGSLSLWLVAREPGGKWSDAGWDVWWPEVPVLSCVALALHAYSARWRLLRARYPHATARISGNSTPSARQNTPPFRET